MAKNVVGMFDTRQDAESAVRALRDSGFPGADISFVAGNARGEYGEVSAYDTTSDSSTEAEEGAGIGATGGAVLGGLAGLLVGLGVLTIPGIGPAVVGGGLAATLGATALGAGIGAAAGGLVGALVGAGVPEEDAGVYAEGVRRGGALVMVQVATDDDASRVADIMDRYNVVDIDERGRTYRESGWERFDESDESYASGSYATTGDGDNVPDRGDYDRSSKVGTAGGGLAGAATGAAIGSAGGPVGTVIGGVAGAVTGGAVGAAGDAAGAEATDDDTTRRGYTGDRNTTRDPATTYGSTTDYSTTGTTGTAGYSDTTLDQGDDATIPVVEEELRVGKREVEQGGVRVNTRVEETPVHEDVTVRDETVHVDRRTVDRPVSDADAANFREGSFEVRERDEEVVVDKQARVVEEVNIRKDVDQRTETIDDTVRRTDVDVEQISGRERGTGYTGTGTGASYDSARSGDADNVPDSGDWERSSKAGTGGGAVAGAATGAAMGSAGGPVGTVIGGVAGAAAGAGVGAAGDAAGAEATDDDTANRDYTTRRDDSLTDKAERGLNADLDRDGDVGGTPRR
jgi:uncharacterized protein (TIGR02271 family)